MYFCHVLLRTSVYVCLFVCLYVCVFLLSSIVYFKTHWSCIQKRDIFLLHKKLPKYYRKGLSHLYYYYNALRWFRKDFFFLPCVFPSLCLLFMYTRTNDNNNTTRMGWTNRSHVYRYTLQYNIYTTPTHTSIYPAILTGFIRIIFFPPFLRFLVQ